MRNDEFDKLVAGFRQQQDKLIVSKGHDYTTGHGTDDRLYNFKWVGDMLDISPLKVAGVYWLKHVLAISTYIKYGGMMSTESIDSRLLDESNYNLLITALIDEARYQVNQTQQGKQEQILQGLQGLQRQQPHTSHPHHHDEYGRVRNPDNIEVGMPKNPEMPNPYDVGNSSKRNF